MEGGVDSQGGLKPQSGHQQRGSKLDILPFQAKIPSQTRGVQFESTFFELTFTEGPFTQPVFTEPTYIEIPPPQAPLVPDHAPWMDLLVQISSLGTPMEELAVVSDMILFYGG